MAIKDWKRNKKTLVNKKLYYKGNKKLSIYKRVRWWGVLIYSVGGNGYSKNFRTEKQAIKFAKAYMRKH